MLPATFVTIASFLFKFCTSSPVYSMQPAYIIANIGTTGRNIRNLPCVSRKTNEKGVCMFAIDCLKANGTHLGTCIDRFYFGSCCHIKPSHEINTNTIDAAIIPENREPPSRLSNTTKIISTPITERILPKTTETLLITTVKPPKTTISTTSKLPSTITTRKIDSTSRPTTSSSAKTSTTFSTSSLGTTTVKPTEALHKLTTFQTIQENTIHSETTQTPKPFTVKTRPTQKIVSTTRKPSTKPVTSIKASTRPRPPYPTKPIKTRPTTKPGILTTRIASKPSKATIKPTKIITKKPPVLTKSTTLSTTRITSKPTRIATVTATTKPWITKNQTTTRIFSTTSKIGLITKVTEKPKVNSTVLTSTTRQAPSSLITTVKATTITPQTVAVLNISTTESNDLPVVSSVLGTVNGNPVTNEIEQPKPLQPPPTTEKPSASLVTWSIIGDETTMSQATTVIPDWVPITTPDGWVLLPSLSTSHPTNTSTVNTTTTAPATSTTVNATINVNYTTSKNETITTETPLETVPILATTTTPLMNDTTTVSSSSSTSGSSTSGSNSSSLTMTTDSAPLMVSSTITSLADGSSTTETSANMSDFTDVCGRRMYPEARIVGGESSTFGKWPWQISLRQWRTSTYLHKCGAALLNENWAITAAHCVDNVPPSDLLLRLGEHDLSTDNEPFIHQERRVQIVASHPQFDPRTFEYDLALLRFYEPVKFQPNIIPVCVPTSSENFVGRTAHVTGWGRLYEDGPLPSVLQEVSVPVINNTVCESMYRSAGYIEHIPHIFICAGYRRGGFDSCEGDSGGPMVIQRPDKRFLLAGVISWGIGCAEPNQPGVYTRISEFKDWINQILQF